MIKIFIILIYVKFTLQTCKIYQDNVFEENYDSYEQKSLSKWYIKDITWCLHNSSLISKDFFTIEDDIEEAFNQWAFYLDLNFYKMKCNPDEKNANINIGFQYVNETFFYYKIHYLTTLGLGGFPPMYLENQHYGSVLSVLNANTTWAFGIKDLIRTNNIKSNEKFIFYSTMLHEIGHNLGLEHLPNRCDILFDFYNEKIELSENDVNAGLEKYKINPNRIDGRSYFQVLNNIYPSKTTYPSVYNYNIPKYPNIPTTSTTSTTPTTSTTTSTTSTTSTTHIPIIINKVENENKNVNVNENENFDIYKKLTNNQKEFFFNKNDENNYYNDIILNSKNNIKYIVINDNLFFVYQIFGRNLKHPFIINKDTNYLGFV